MSEKINIRLGCAVCDALSNNELGTLYKLYTEFQEACREADGELPTDKMWLARVKIDDAYPSSNTSISAVRDNIVVFVPKWMIYNGKYCAIRVECEFGQMIRCSLESFLIQKVKSGLYKNLDRITTVFRGDIEFLYGRIRLFRYNTDARFRKIATGLKRGNTGNTAYTTESMEHIKNPEDPEPDSESDND